MLGIPKLLVKAGARDVAPLHVANLDEVLVSTLHASPAEKIAVLSVAPVPADRRPPPSAAGVGPRWSYEKLTGTCLHGLYLTTE